MRSVLDIETETYELWRTCPIADGPGPLKVSREELANLKMNGHNGRWNADLTEYMERKIEVEEAE